MILDWKWYEKRITGLFEKLKGAEVEHNVMEMGQDSHTPRQIDIRISVPLTVDLGDGFSFTIPVKIIVDCKARERAIDISVIDEVFGLKDDVRAHLAVIVTPTGISEAAKERAKAVGVRPIVVTTDLIAVASRFPPPEDMGCLICDYTGEEDHSSPVVFWQSSFEGRCSWCNGLHVRCPECYEVFGVDEAEYDQAIKCPCDCGAVFLVEKPVAKDDVEKLEILLALDAMFLTAAYSKSTKRLTPNEVHTLVERTRWQHWGEAAPTIGVTEAGYMEYRDDENLYLTVEGENWAYAITNAVYPYCY